jgi:nucleoside-diphosphate-sugar epimerase
MNKFLVTGGAGFIGSNIVEELLKKGEFVKVLDNFSTGKRENVLKLLSYKNFELIEGDIRSFHTVRDAVQGVDFVLHQAALPSVQRSVKDPLTTNDVNINGTLNLLEASREFDIKRFIFASSSSVYGNVTEGPKNENTPVQPLSPYALSKYTGERYCQIYNQLFGLETVCLRYFNVFGPHQDPSSQYSAVIPKFIKAMINDKLPVVYGDGLQSRDFTYVTNNVQANIIACFADNVAGEVFNIAFGARYTLMDLIQEINLNLNKNIKPIFENEKKGEVKHSLADISKAKRIMNYNPEVNFQNGLKLTIENILSNEK